MRYQLWSPGQPAIGGARRAPGGRAGAIRTLALASTLVFGLACGPDSQPTSPRVVATVSVQPAQHTLAVGDELAMTARALDEAGEIVAGRGITWSSSNESVARVTDAGRVTAVAAGTVQIRATADGKSGSAELTVTVPAVASIAVSPTVVVLEVGESRILTAVTRDANGNVLSGREVTWSVDTPNASVSPSGVVFGLVPGYATITATSEGKTVGAAVTIGAGASSNYDLVYHRKSGEDVSEIFVLPLGTGAAPVRVNAGTTVSHATPAPSGQRIAFAVSQFDAATQEQIDDIYAVDRNGMNVKRLTAARGVDDQPAWSPAGGRIAYRHAETGARADIWIMDADGANAVNLTADFPATSRQSAPAWSADGSRIAFASLQSGFTGTTASIWTMRADGSDKRMLTSTLTGYDTWPTWSPDGQRIAFIRQYETDSDITFVNASGGEAVRLALPGRQFTPAWSPDGEWIAYTQPGVGYLNVYTVTPRGTEVRLRTVDQTWKGGLEPAWIRKQ